MEAATTFLASVALHWHMSEESHRTARERRLDTDAGNPAVQVAEVVAELKGTEPDQLESTYDQIDHVLDHIFSNPPSPDADVVVAFTYEGYRVTVAQDGMAEFEPVD